MGNVLKIEKIEDLHCDAGWRTFSFLKVTTNDGLIGWSEYTEADGSRGLTGVIRGLAEPLIGLDPRPVQQIASMLWVRQVQAPGGINSRAIAGRIVSDCGRNANPNVLARSSKFWHAFIGDRGRGGCVSSHG